MKANTIRKWTDLALWFDMCFIVGTGLLMAYRLVPGFKGGHGLTFLGMDRHQWGTYHLWAAYLLLALVVVHLAVNYAFIVNVISWKKQWVTIVLTVVGLAGVAFFLVTPIERGATREGGGQGAAKLAVPE